VDKKGTRKGEKELMSISTTKLVMNVSHLLQSRGGSIKLFEATTENEPFSTPLSFEDERQGEMVFKV
jgi:hypothetical protein